MVADTSAIGFEHPYGIFLALVKVRYAQSFKVKVGKRLMRTVEVGTHKAVEKAVVTLRELLLERVRCPSQPIHEALPDFLNLGVCLLYLFAVPNLDGLYFSCVFVYNLPGMVL